MKFMGEQPGLGDRLSITDKVKGPANKIEFDESKIRRVGLYEPLHTSENLDELFRKAMKEGYFLEGFFIADLRYRDHQHRDLREDRSQMVIYFSKRDQPIDAEEGMIVKEVGGRNYHFYGDQECDILSY